MVIGWRSLKAEARRIGSLLTGKRQPRKVVFEIPGATRPVTGDIPSAKSRTKEGFTRPPNLEHLIVKRPLSGILPGQFNHGGTDTVLREISDPIGN